uniref:Fibronectin type-III domain-containing protein n=1 Tax=Castor canadensis TaxID=51338 RepID=A0A8C0W2F5_CASCN
SALGRLFKALAGWTLESEALTRDVGTWLLIYTCVCSCICWGISVPEQGGGEGPRMGTFTCLTNGILRIDCQWSALEVDQGSGSWLLFTSNQAPGSQHRCIFQASMCTVVLPPEEVILPTDNFTITLHHCISGEEQISLVDPQYLPWRHVKLDPPSDLQSNISSGYCVLTWSLSPALEPMSSLLSYELAFKRQEEAWERALHKDRIVGVTWIILEAMELYPGSYYEARLRVQMAMLKDDVVEEERPEGQWSEWSQPVCFLSPQRPGLLIPPWGWPYHTLFAMSIFLLLAGLTYLLFKLSPRLKRAFYQNVPSPAAFFHPLYNVHDGNFQVCAGRFRARACPQPIHNCVNTPQGAWEAITLLTYSPAYPRGLEEVGATGPGLPVSKSSEDAFPAECVDLGEQLSAYLPQEDWTLMFPNRPAPPDSEGDSSDYCTLGCYGEYHPSAFPRRSWQHWAVSPSNTLSNPESHPLC